MWQKYQIHLQQFQATANCRRGLGWTRNEDVFSPVSWSPRLPAYCLELPVAVIYVKRGSGCLVGTEQPGDRDHPDQGFYLTVTLSFC